MNMFRESLWLSDLENARVGDHFTTNPAESISLLLKLLPHGEAHPTLDVQVTKSRSSFFMLVN
jgi:hypothetical protein